MASKLYRKSSRLRHGTTIYDSAPGSARTTQRDDDDDDNDDVELLETRKSLV